MNGKATSDREIPISFHGIPTTGYFSFMQKRFNPVTKLIPRAICWFGSMALAGSVYGNPAAEPSARDARHHKLEIFFRSFGCPAPYYASDYIRAADAYSIDYRLLPAISLLESTCGLYQRNNNRWGWDSARTPFASVREGLRYIAFQLSRGRFYRNKTLDQKIRIYNPDPAYERKIKLLMRKIDNPRQPLTLARVDVP